MALTDIKNPYTGLSTPDATKYIGGADNKRFHRDDTAYQHQLSQNIWDAQLAIMADDRAYAEEIYNKYNSPSAQVEQMRKAGLNPDLMGVSPQSMSAPQSSLPSSSIPSSSSSGQDFGLSIAQSALQFLPQAISMYTNMKSSLIDVRSKELQFDKELLGIDSQMEEFALSDILNSVTPADIKDGVIPRDILQGKRNIDARYLSFNGNKRFTNSYTAALSRLIDGSQSQIIDAIYNRGKSSASHRYDFISLLSKYGLDLSDDDALLVFKEINKLSYELNKKSLENQSTEQDLKIGLQFANRGQELMNEHPVAGALLYFLGVLMQSNLKFSINQGPKGTSTNFGF